MSGISTEIDGDILIVRFQKARLTDEVEAVQIGAELRQVALQTPKRRLLVDLDGVERISSTMIGQLFGLKNWCAANHVLLKLCGLSPDIQQLLDIVQLTNFVDTYEDRQSAAEAFEQEFELQQNVEDVAAWQVAAEQGDAEAQYQLAMCYDEGRGVPHDPEAAFDWYWKAAQAGHTEAQYAVGRSYAYGIHVPQDYEQALSWYRKAAEQGHRESQYLLGISYQYGLAGDPDMEQAAHWYRLAAAQGHNRAQQALSKLAPS